jgi:SAM-dependent methyltransferase
MTTPDEPDTRAMFTASFWDEKYAGSDRVWSGNPNRRLVEQVSDLPVGTAVDAGCGEGADVVWLARRGWRVTGVDVSGVALERAAAHAADEGVAASTDWLRADLLAGDPIPAGVDLVTAAFVHTPPELLGVVYGRLADAVAPGGTLVVVAHHPDDIATGLRNARLSGHLIAPEQVTAVLDSGRHGAWAVQVAEGQQREQDGPDGHPVTVTDTVVRARRVG